MWAASPEMILLLMWALPPMTVRVLSSTATREAAWIARVSQLLSHPHLPTESAKEQTKLACLLFSVCSVDFQ